MPENKISFATRFGYRLIYGGAYLLGLLPNWFLYYVVVEILYLFLYLAGRYRVAVVRGNLQSAFPEKTKPELRKIERRFYRNLSEYFVDAAKLAGISEKEYKRRVVTLGREELNRELDGRNWLAMLGHVGSWEFMNVYAFYPEMSALVSAYRPLKNKAFDMYYKKVRNRFPKIRSVPMNDLMRFYMSHRDGFEGHSLSIVLIADQNAPIDAQSQWIPFLNHATVFFHGGEKIARKFGLPVYFMHIRKLKRGHYEQWFERIWDGVSPIENHEITNRYAAILEANIRERPELWMWSHRRWKWRLEGRELAEFNLKWGTDIPE